MAVVHPLPTARPAAAVMVEAAIGTAAPFPFTCASVSLCFWDLLVRQGSFLPSG